MKRLACALMVILWGCSSAAPPPEGQLLVYVTTDAPLPPAPGKPESDVVPLFDRAELSVIEPGASAPCTDCRRVLALDAEAVDAGRVSFGLVAPPGRAGYRLRARLFRSATTISAEPRPASTIEAVAELPAVVAGEVTRLTLVLRTDDVAKPELPVALVPGKPPRSQVGSYPGARRTPCPSAPPPGMACVPGGAFWMGDPSLDTTDGAEYDGRLERIVVLSPFFVDTTEVTVSAFRASGLATPLSPGGPSNNPHVADADFFDCRYTDAPGANEDYAVNCLSWQKAEAYCESLGKTLPTEAQLEYLESRLGRAPFVWGTDAPTCADAVFDRDASGGCKPFGPAPIGSGARDRLDLDGVEVLDVTGGVTEWARDQWNRETEGCWGTGVFFDPFCDTPSALDPAARVMRGGGWYASIWLLRASLRARTVDEQFAVAGEIGFRCVSSP